MSLADEIKHLNQQKSSLSCGTCSWLANQTQEDISEFNAYVASGKTLVDLYKLCVAHGLDRKETTFRRCARQHREYHESSK